MSIHSYTRIWLHVIWATLNREKCLTRNARITLAEFIARYAKEKNIYVKALYVNADHVHVLIDLPSHLSIEDAMQLLKGASSHYVNEHNLLGKQFNWQRGYGAFSVSTSIAPKVISYIKNQGTHHKEKNFDDEFGKFLLAQNIKPIIEKNEAE